MPDFTDPQWCYDLFEKMGINEQVLLGSAVVLIVLGIVNIFFGYPIFRIVLSIVAGLAGGGASYAFACQAFGGDIPASVIVAVAAGVLSLLAFYQLYLMSVFVAGAALGWFLSYTAMDMIGVAHIPLVIAIAGVVCGLIALLIQKLAIILATAVFGAVYTTLGAWLAISKVNPQELAEDPAMFFDWQNPDARLIIMAVSVLVLAGLGVFVQYKIVGALKRRKEGPAESMEESPPPKDDFED